MEQKQYEQLYYTDIDFPVIFHYDTLSEGEYFLPHWHENWELLYIMKGRGKIMLNMQETECREGDLIIVPSAAMHNMKPAADMGYYCLIPNRDFCAAYGLRVDEVFFRTRVRNDEVKIRMKRIIDEFAAGKRFYKSEIMAELASLLVYLARNFSEERPAEELRHSGQLETVKRAFRYIDRHYGEPITGSELAEAAGFSKYYFIRLFKQVTGMPPRVYINSIRCIKAQKLLGSGRCNVSEAAAQCGFDNLSYFSKTYKKFIGELPSQTLAGFKEEENDTE